MYNWVLTTFIIKTKSTVQNWQCLKFLFHSQTKWFLPGPKCVWKMLYAVEIVKYKKREFEKMDERCKWNASMIHYLWWCENEEMYNSIVFSSFLCKQFRTKWNNCVQEGLLQRINKTYGMIRYL